ncbi:MAG: mandelate racemase/muconate lactonizing enzyme family protein [bacterium]|nr:mandelate racemase/muconate lactonizing enzyme family protein [bacterium]
MYGGSPLLVVGMETAPIRVGPRHVWLIVRLTTNKGLAGLGEASLGPVTRLDELDDFFRLVEGGSPLEIRKYRARARDLAARGGLRAQTAMSAVEQALWDITGKALDAPVHVLLGGAVRTRVPVYANINLMTTDRSPVGFARSVAKAAEAGFSIFKAAPFDGFPPAAEGAEAAQRAADLGIDCVQAMREAVGEDVSIRVDCHRYFGFERAVDTALRLEPYVLDWFEEPTDPTDAVTTARIKAAIPQRLAGGELLFGVEGFAPLCRRDVLDVVMPDIMHCGGILEGHRIAAAAAAGGVLVSPHNACGPVATAAAAQFAAGTENFDSLELQWGQVPWRSDLTDPPERVRAGILEVPAGPGLGIDLNNSLVTEHLA